MILIFLGPPGAGKGTQAERIVKDYNVLQISTGDILRANRKNGTPLGKEAEKYMNAGELVPDKLIIDMIKEELSNPVYKNGYILDGFPRTVHQAVALNNLLRDLNSQLDAVLVLEAPHEELINRLTSRRTCNQCGKSYHLLYAPPLKDGVCDIDGAPLIQRKDDTLETVQNRLKVYAESTFPLIDFYVQEDKALFIDGVGELDEVYSRIKGKLDNLIMEKKSKSKVKVKI